MFCASGTLRRGLALALLAAGFLVAAGSAQDPPRAITTQVITTAPAPGRLPAPSTQPVVAPRVTVARIEGSQLFSGFTLSGQLQKEFEKLQSEFAEARKAGDANRVREAGDKIKKLAADTRQQMSRAIEYIAKRDGIDVVVGEVIFRSGDVNVPDITPQVLARLNATVTTAPASQPATAPAGTPATAPAK